MLYDAVSLLSSNEAWLLLLAAVLCVGAIGAALVVFTHAAQHEAATARSWVFLAAITAGTGTWGAHCVALLAFSPSPEIVVGYAAPAIMAALLFAIAAAWVGLTIFRRATRPASARMLGLA